MTTPEPRPGPGQVPLVDYLVLDARPYLTSHECSSCGALYFDRRNACARCFAAEFGTRKLATTGTIRAFTIVHRAAPSVATPYTSVVVDLDGGGCVKANLLGVSDPGRIQPQERVALQTFPLGTDDDGVEAVSFGFQLREGGDG